MGQNLGYIFYKYQKPSVISKWAYDENMVFLLILWAMGWKLNVSNSEQPFLLDFFQSL